MTSNDKHVIQYPDFGGQYRMQGSNEPAPYRPEAFRATPVVHPVQWNPGASLRPHTQKAQASLHPLGSVDVREFLQLRQQVIVLVSGLSNATRTIEEMAITMNELHGKLDDLSRVQSPSLIPNELHTTPADATTPGRAQKPRVPQIEVSILTVTKHDGTWLTNV
jgi:hypothetical protein